MFAAMGVEVGGQDAPWLGVAEAEFRSRLAERDRFAAYVVDGPDGLVACAAGWLERRLPGVLMTPDVGHVANICTEPARRREGLARACLEALLGWLRGAGVRRVDLHATEQGAPLYHSLGFTAPAYPALTLLL